MRTPIIAVNALTSCSGCQLSLLNCEEELPSISEHVRFSSFPLACSSEEECAQYDAVLVEGAVSTAADVDILMRMRARGRLLVAFGTCAAWGGIAGLKNDEDRMQLVGRIYGGYSDIRSFPPQPVRRFVSVDFVIPGCPPERHEILAVLGGLLRGTLPVLPRYPVCMECRMRENRCLLEEDDLLCLGPLVQAGCNARCPGVSVPCEGCRGPAAEANTTSALELFAAKGLSAEQVASRMSRFCTEWNDAGRH